MPRVTLRLFPLLLFLLLVSAPSAFAAQGLAIDPATCLGCHGDKISIPLMAESVHGRNGCTSCHVEIVDLTRHMKGEVKVGKVQCVRCHKKEAAEHANSVHLAKGVTCVGCHSDIHRITHWNKDKRRVLAICVKCHKDERGFRESVHGKAVLAGNQDSAACNDCHNLHEIKQVGDATSHVNREFHTKVCLKCHANKELVKRNHLPETSVESYMSSYHGKNYRLGYPEKVAGCADCHTAHSILPPNDPRSSVNEANLVATCGKCHKHDSKLFTKFYAHGEHNDREHYPILYYTFMAMTGLLVSTFAVFWLHTLLWMVRGFVENREKAAALAEGHQLHQVEEGHKQYRRFQPRHVFLHLCVIVSFLGLSLTGLPLKFSDQGWAKVLMGIIGGAPNAAFIHRICAGITFFYFGSAILLSIHFLFIRKDLKGNFFQKLFGPESLCPNLRDINDVAAMVRWFFFKGPKPTFERWTYWEKFDFLAVFWGMFAIGGSGLMLALPELFGSFLPGWAFNVATIIHSDEALLATGFIFSVHFFNTHGRPEKFPMDFVIFNGQMSKHEFVEERGDQWARYEQEGITEKFAAKRSSGIVYDFLLKTFGFTAVFIGCALMALMIYAFINPG
ncbi:cytochrome c3 family protein [Geomesophilobacter sediminis]|uniref:Cytochrome c3 family protein n=1 Tax=Geomesophilobacter sediminis TaxID=2798584 RepID=A0A8J7JEW8_9BACT|nr:cytochrome c3 family protein [Geomesophilobacter sediminis]MBJ6724719.1 cytochrome c3 family protein [Geomesophilobacter sediminis]